MPLTVRSLLTEAVACLQQAGRRNPRVDAEVLLADTLQRPRSWLLAHSDTVLSPERAEKFRELVQQRTTGRPLQYVRGRQEFFGRSFFVDERVLIPRPETEVLVETVLSLNLQTPSPIVADVGTGSGCIGVTLACERPNWRVIATDVSMSALQVARRNSLHLGVGARVELVCADLLEPFEGLSYFDAIVSNPPYVTAGDPLIDPEVALFEPATALYAGTVGTEIHEALLRTAHACLKSQGFLVLEMGFGQSERLLSLAQQLGWQPQTVAADLAGIPRCMVLTRTL